MINNTYTNSYSGLAYSQLSWIQSAPFQSEGLEIREPQMNNSK